MLTSCLTGRTAHVRIPSVPDTGREGQLRVDLIRSPSRRGMTASCAHRTARIDVERTYRIAAVDAQMGKKRTFAIQALIKTRPSNPASYLRR
jgi:hypothetical protein